MGTLWLSDHTQPARGSVGKVLREDMCGCFAQSWVVRSETQSDQTDQNIYYLALHTKKFANISFRLTIQSVSLYIY